MQFGGQRSLAIDGLKAVAALLIVLHHLAFYGPMADHAGVMLPWLRDWLAGDARMAVQVFLVVGGFLAARSLAPTGTLARVPLLWVMRNRFMRLALPYYVVLLLAVACNEWARGWMSHPSISSPASAGQLLAHVLLLQDVLGFESLSAGLWYVAIDLQLFLMLAVLWRLGSYANAAVKQRHPRSTIALPALFVSLLALASLLHFNRDPAFEPWGVYFFGSYALGALAWWGSGQARPGWWLAVIAACTAGALVVAFRERLLIALIVAVALGLTSQPALSARFAGTAIGPAAGWRRIGHGLRAAVHWLAAISYAMFLVHFPVCLVVNAAFTRFAPPDPHWQLAGLAVAVAASVAAGATFHAWVEAPLLRWLRWRPIGTTGHPPDRGLAPPCGVPKERAAELVRLAD